MEELIHNKIRKSSHPQQPWQSRSRASPEPEQAELHHPPARAGRTGIRGGAPSSHKNDAGQVQHPQNRRPGRQDQGSAGESSIGGRDRRAPFGRLHTVRKRAACLGHHNAAVTSRLWRHGGARLEETWADEQMRYNIYQ